ncbi:hypothetical protein ACFL2V_09750 [Pseudomonadota bacterium]
MSERVRGEWGWRRMNPETPEQNLRELARTELARISWEADDELARELAEKGLEKIRIKDQVDDMQRHADDITIRQDMKRLGSIVVVEASSRFNAEDIVPGLTIQEGDSYLDLHIPPLSDADKSPNAIKHSFHLLADYIQYHEIDVEHIVGVSYERLARVSRRWGFDVVEVPLPEDIKRGVENVFRSFRDRVKVDKGMGEILLCYQRTEDFLGRFSGSQ